MKSKKLFSFLLAVILICSCILTGCSDKDTMFSDMKEISQIKSAEFSGETDIIVQSEEQDIQYHLTIDGQASAGSASYNFTITSGIMTFTLKDFIRIADNTIYINLASVFSSLSGTGELDDLKDWVSVPFSSMDNDTIAVYQSFNEALIDSLEKACKGQDISKSGDTWTLNIPGDKMVSFAKAALDEIDANISTWYDLYVELLEKTGSDELLKGFSEFFGEEYYSDYDFFIDDSSSEYDNSDADEYPAAEEDPIQALKDGKKEFIDTWKESSVSFRESLSELEESIKSEEVAASGKLNVSLKGKEGSRTAEESADFQYEDKSSSSNISLSLTQKLTETDDISVEAPDAADVMTMDEFSEWMVEFFSDEDYYGYSMSEEEEAAILSSLEDNQIYLFDSEYDDMVPYVVTIDPDIYEIEAQINDYYADLYIPGPDFYASLVYERGDMEADMKEFYLDEGDETSTLSTDIGEVTYFTDVEDGYAYTLFGFQLDEKSYISGMLELEASDDPNMENYIRGLLKELKPYEASSQASSPVNET